MIRLIADTNILLLHAVGSVAPSRLKKVSLGKLQDEQEEFRRISLVLEKAQVHTTMLVLGEFGALLESRLGLKGDRFVGFLRAYAESLQKLEVVEIDKDRLLGSAGLTAGLADSSVLEAAAATGWLLLTSDDELRRISTRLGIPTAPFYDLMFGKTG